jgi:DNA (cytosine-5)-methyltransferase 1
MPTTEQFVAPGIEDAEALQGFDRGWTQAATVGAKSTRWKLIGNAVSVPVATWLATSITIGGYPERVELGDDLQGNRLPISATGGLGRAWRSFRSVEQAGHSAAGGLAEFLITER